MYLGDFIDGHSVYDVDPSTILINDYLQPVAYEIVTEHPEFEGDVLKLTFDIIAFLNYYMPVYNTSIQTYSISGDFYERSEFTTEGEFTLVRHICGDVNADGIINIGDVVYLITYLYRSGSPPMPTSCIGDVNCDDIVNVGDVVYLITYLYRGGSPPCPDCCNPPW
jgi:hypothetical protein